MLFDFGFESIFAEKITYLTFHLLDLILFRASAGDVDEDSDIHAVRRLRSNSSSKVEGQGSCLLSR